MYRPHPPVPQQSSPSHSVHPQHCTRICHTPHPWKPHLLPHWVDLGLALSLPRAYLQVISYTRWSCAAGTAYTPTVLTLSLLLQRLLWQIQLRMYKCHPLVITLRLPPGAMFRPVTWAYRPSSLTVLNLERKNMPRRLGLERNRPNICLFSVVCVTSLLSCTITIMHLHYILTTHWIW